MEFIESRRPAILVESAKPIFGPMPTDKPIPLRELTSTARNVTVWGEIFSAETKETLDHRMVLYTFDVTDYTDSIAVKLLLPSEYRHQMRAVQPGCSLLIRGDIQYDKYCHEDAIRPRSIAIVEQVQVEDTAPRKRVELLLHTNMSEMDGVSTAVELINQAHKWGHKAVAITDYNVVRAFPEAMNAVKTIWKTDPDFKVIYGMEGSYVDLTSEDLDRLMKDRQTYYHYLFQDENCSHMTILVKNQISLKNLYKLVSLSHLHPDSPLYFFTKGELEQQREGLLIGSACNKGRLFCAVKEGLSFDRLCEIASFYDYLEIQPAESPEYNRAIVEIGEKLKKLVVATGNVYYINPTDCMARNVVLEAWAQEPEDKPARYFRTTDEMLQEFSYLGEKKSYEVVVENTNRIADMISQVRPIPEGYFPPVIDDAGQQLRKLTWRLAIEKFGKPLPENVKERLTKELDFIAWQDANTLYIVLQKLANNSQRCGYPVGPRGAAGSSLVAHIVGISEINPLEPHYLCPQCKHSEFITDGSVESGFDLSAKNCPNCGTPMTRDGHTIPLETFFGFDGDRVVDIDLHFSRKYQGYAHRSLRSMFGKDRVIDAGYTHSMTERAAQFYVNWYAKKHKLALREAEKRRLAIECSNTHRGTGVHPGGVFVLPKDKEIEDFCPVDCYADDKSKFITHFDFHDLHDTIYKLDLLSHDTPTICHFLEEYTGIPLSEVPMCDPKVMSLFTSPAALGVTPKELGGVKTGTLSLPELGTEFVHGMLLETQPKTFSDLVRVFGLSHGVDVWLGNAQELIRDGICTVSDVPGNRDDIMLYLISKGIERKTAFEIMEIVRKGKARKKFTEKHIALMRKHGVPQWYIDSCSKICYLFPKAHSVGYMITAVRMGWYKVYRPAEYYAAYFTVRKEGFDAAAALAGKADVMKKLQKLEARIINSEATREEETSFEALQIVNEMLARGIRVLPPEQGKSHRTRFMAEDGMVRLPLSVGRKLT